MIYAYLKALHVIFVVTWFAGLFYLPRLFVYNTELSDKPAEVREPVRAQFGIMMKRLWYGITWPSAMLTLILGLTVMVRGGWDKILFQPPARWLLIKLGFVLLLYAYHFSLHKIFREQMRGIFRFTSQQLRIWNEVATIFLVAIVTLAVVKESISWVWAVGGLVLFVIVLMSAIRLYRLSRKRNKG